MMSRALFPAFGLLFALASPLPGWEPPPPPPEDGKVWLLAVPTDAAGLLLDPTSFTAHCVDAEKEDDAAVFPSVAYFQPPAGALRFWLEGGGGTAGDDRMSPNAQPLDPASLATPGSSRLASPVVPAGRVSLPEGFAVDPGLELRLYHLEAADYEGGEKSQLELWRRAATTEIAGGLRMPRGQTVALVWDRARRRVTALSRPFEVVAGKLQAAPLGKPGDGQDLLVRLRRATVPEEGPRAEVFVRTAGKKIPPQLLVRTAGSVFAGFYGLPPGAGELVAELTRDTLPFTPLELAAGKAEALELELVARPSLSVRLVLPDAVREQGAEVLVKSRADGAVLARQPAGNAKVLEFPDLPAQVLDVELVSPLGTVRQPADLTAGQDGAVELAAEAAEVYGRVFLVDEPAAGRIDFLTTAGGKVSARSDPHGDYRVLATAPLRQASIELDGRPGKPYHEFFVTGTISSGERDFHLPDTLLEVKVKDAATGQGVAGAGLRVKNTFRQLGKDGQPLPPRRPGAEPPTQSLMQSATTGEKGIATLYYLTAGTVEIAAGAEGYLQPEKPEVLQIAADEHRQLEMRLQPAGKKALLEVLLPGGEKAAGAQVFLLGKLDPMDVLATGKTGPDGRVELPETLAGALLAVRHPQAAFLIGSWQPREAPNAARIELPPAAEKPLVLRARAGGEPLAYAEIVLFVEGKRLGPHLIFQLTGSRPLTDGEGLFTAGGLPRAAIKALVFSRQDLAKAESARAGQLDGQAIEIPYPWPPLVEVEGIE